MSRRDIELRVRNLATYIIKTGCTVRAAAKEFNVSKSTVHKDITDRIKEIDYELFIRVREITLNNKMERHVRGGKATSERYHLEREKHKV